MLPCSFRLIWSLTLLLVLSAADARPLAAAQAAPAQAAPAPTNPIMSFDAKAWARILQKSPDISCFQHLLLSDQEVATALKAWRAEFPQGIMLMPMDLATILSSNAWQVEHGQYAQICRTDDQPPVLNLFQVDHQGVQNHISSMALPTEAFSALTGQILTGVILNDALMERVDWESNNMALPEVITQLCSGAAMDFVTRRDLGTSLLVTMHLSNKSRLECINLAALACGWSSFVTHQPQYLPGSWQANEPSYWTADVINRWQNPESSEDRRHLLAHPLEVLHAMVVEMNVHQHERVVTVLPYSPAEEHPPAAK